MEQVNSFLAPLKGSVTILFLHDKETKTALSRFLMRCAYLRAANTSILDADAFYCTNIDKLTENMNDDGHFLSETEILLLPEKTFRVGHLTPLITSKTQVLILDDLNSLYSLASSNHKSHELFVFMKLLSYNARMNKSWVIATAYRAERSAQTSREGRSLAGLGDLLVDANLHEHSLLLKAGFGRQWPNNEFRL